MTDPTPLSPAVQAVFDALGIPCKGVTGLRLIIEPDQLICLEVRRFVESDEMDALTHWILEHDVKAVQIADELDPPSS